MIHETLIASLNLCPQSLSISQEADERDIRMQKLVLESAISNTTQVNYLWRDVQGRSADSRRVRNTYPRDIRAQQG